MREQRTWFRLIIFLATMTAVLVPLSASSPPPAVPPEFQDLYPVLQTDLDTFQQTLDGLWNKVPAQTGFAAGLLAADSNQGSALLGPSTQAAIQADLTAMQNMGITTATISVHFPILYAPYYLSPQGGLSTGHTAADYISFYQWVVNTAHSMNPPMRVAMESYVDFTKGITPGLPNLLSYYRSLGLDGYMAARAAMEVTIAQQIHPDFLSLQGEPDTEATQSGYSDFNNASTDIQFVNQMTAALDSASPPIAGLHTSLKISAGIGTWSWNAFESLIDAEAAMPGLDELTMHILSINAVPGNDLLGNALPFIQVAQQNHKPIAVAQAWLIKIRDSELPQGAESPNILGRSAYSFWTPLDEEFLQVLTKLAYYTPMDFISPFWGNWYFYTYLDYSNISGCPYNPAANPPSSGYPDATCDGSVLQSIETADANSIVWAGGPIDDTGEVYEQLMAGHLMPEVTSGPAVSAYPIVGKAAQLFVTGNDGSGGSDVSYLWQVTGNPPALPQIATPAAATTNVTFSAAGSYSFQVTVTGPDGLSVTRSFSFPVSASGPGSPVITSKLSQQGAAGTPLSYQITATPAATSFGAAGLPSGLTIKTSSGMISGVPVAYGSFPVTLSASNATGMGTATLSLAVAAPAPGAAIYRINCGATDSYTDPSGNVWSPDEDYNGGLVISTTQSISGTTTPVVYQTARQALPVYTIPLPDGAYTVVLKFAEIQYLAAGKRQFNVSINGTQVLTNFDILAAAGAANTVVDLPFPATASGGAITIALTSGAAGAPLLNGIEIQAASAAQSPHITSPLTVQGTAGTLFTYQITTTPAATSFYAIGLPSGLTLNSSSGLISGTPAVYGTFPVTLGASNTYGTSNAVLNLTIAAPATGAALYRINCGATSTYTDPSGNVWSPDQDFTGGSSVSTTNTISGTTTAVVYQTARQGSPTYTIPLPDGTYTVVLKFAEIQYSAAGKRQFNVSINGAQVLTNFDIVAAAGAANTAVDLPFPATASGGAITIALTSGAAGVPLINGIVIKTSNVTQSPHVTSPLTAQGMAGTPFTYPITTSPAATSFYAIGLPSGLALNSSSGLISGTPAVYGSFPVTLGASNAYGTSNAVLTLAIAAPAAGTALYRINCAATSSYTDPAGNVWSPDEYYSGGLAISTTNTISGTTTPVVYQTARQALPAYTIPLPDGTYTVVLKFAEIQYSAAGKRQFNVTINGTQVLTNFDILATAGAANTAVDLPFPATASGGALTLALTSGAAGVPLINGIEIDAASVAQSPHITSPLTAQATASVPFTYQITASPAATGFYAIGLPSGLTLNATSGLISGTPAVYGSFPVTLGAANAHGASNAVVILTIAAPAVGTTLYRINCGATSTYTDPAGNVWSPDADFTGGSSVSTTNTISGTTTPAVYQTARHALPTYTIPLPDGTYTVVLKFAEIQYGATGKRQFNVSINGAQVLTNFDIVAAAGAANTAVDLPFPATASSGAITIQFTSGAAGVPLINGITIRTANATQSPRITSVLTPQGTAGTPFSYQITSTPAATSFYAIGLPPGLTLNASSGLISGTTAVYGSYQITLGASNSYGTGTTVLNLAIAAAAPGAALYRINCGTASSYIDPAGNVWTPDEDFSGGSVISTTNSISGTTTPVVYQTARKALPTYTLPVNNGAYTVMLKFAEVQYNAAGKRQFNVSINGVQVLTNFDIVAAAGASNTAVDRSFPATATNGAITIQLTSGAAGGALLNGIQVSTAN